MLLYIEEEQEHEDESHGVQNNYGKSRQLLSQCEQLTGTLVTLDKATYMEKITIALDTFSELLSEK